MKFFSAPAVMAVLAGSCAVLLGGCSTELDGFGAKQSVADANRVDANRVMAAPTGSVESSSVPPPPAPSGARAATAGDAVTPRTASNTVPLTPPPTNPGGTAYAATANQTQLAGAWTFGWDNGRHTCPVTLSTNRGMSGLAAQADVSCPSEIFMTKGWDTLGGDVVLQNHQGKVTARLQPAGPNRYVGVITDTNQPIVLTR